MTDAGFTDEQLRLISDVTERAMATPLSQRRALVEEACGGDERVFAEVWELVGAETSPEEVRGPKLPMVAMPGGPRTIERIGPYRILERLGEGGFGVVYLAEQTEPVRRKVALKVIKPGMDSAAVVARFEAERQALAMMDHPSVAHVFDGGTTPDHRPYFAMELVRGLPITEHCDRHKLSVRERVGLFVSVCEAVQHAHSKGVIHRDLKPSNILVEYSADKATPKVIDFGVAKALTHRLTERTIHTEIGQLIGTPQYMSPEQAEHSVQDVDTRSDVYSLGVVLYELLVGRPPFDQRLLETVSVLDIQRFLRDTEPPKPSTRLSELLSVSEGAGGDRKIPELRRMDAGGLTRTLQQDLDWILLRCLEKDRERRYATAADLAAELKRYLNDEPVLAGPPSVRYRVGKFVRRNRAAVGAAGLIAATLVIATGVSISLAVIARAESQRAERALSERAEALERERAARVELAERAEELQLVADFQAEQLAAIDPELIGARLREALLERVPEGERETFAASLAPVNFTDVARVNLGSGIFDPSIEAIDRQFSDTPVTRAALLQTVAEAFEGMGLAADGIGPQERALALLREALGVEDPRTLAALDRLGQLRSTSGDFLGAEDALTEALEARRRVLGDDALGTLASMNNLGVLRRNQRRFDEAEALYREALEGRRAALGPTDPATLASMNNLAGLHRARGQLAEAESLFREVVDAKRKAFGIDDPSMLLSMTNLADTQYAMGKYAEAHGLFGDVLSTRRRTLGETHPKTLASMINAASAGDRLGRTDEAEALYEEAISLCRTTLGIEHPETLRALNNMGTLQRNAGNIETAERYYREALEGRRRAFGEDNRQTLVSTHNLATMLRDAGDLKAAEELLSRSAGGARRVLPENDVFRLITTITLGRVRGSLGRWSEGVDLIEESYPRLQELGALGEANMRTLAGLIADFYDAWHEADPNGGYDAEAARYRAIAEPPAELQTGSTPAS